METIKNILLSTWIVIIVIGIIIVGILAKVYEWDTIYCIYEIIGVTTTVAISSVALYAYVVYAYNKYNTHTYLSKKNQITNESVALMIHFGSLGCPRKSMEKHAKELGILEENMVFKSFGDKENIVSVEDISDLRAYLGQFKNDYSFASDIHLYIKGVGTAFFVCGDLLGNWKRVTVYHYASESYVQWYLNEKYRIKHKDDVNKTQIADV